MENKTKYNYLCRLVGFSWTWTMCRYQEDKKISKRLYKYITKPISKMKPHKHNILRPSKL